MNSKSFLLEHGKKIMGVGVILIFAVALIFSFKNSYEVETVSLENKETLVVNDVERKVVPASDIRYFFESNIPFYHAGLFDTYDREYILISHQDIVDFHPIFYKFQKELGIMYIPNVNDCDDNAKTFSRLFTLYWNKNRTDKISPAIGTYAFLNRNDIGHMVVVAFTEKEGMLHPIFYEVYPDLVKIELTEEEFLGILGGEMN